MRRPNTDEDDELRSSHERGTALVEFAIVSVLFFMLIFVGLDFGYAFMIKENMTHAAQEGLRTALVTQGTQSAQAAAAVTAATQRMASFPATQTQWGTYCGTPAGGALDVCTSWAQCPSIPGSQCLTITLDYDYKDHSIIGNLLFDQFIPNTLTVTATQRMS